MEKSKFRSGIRKPHLEQSHSETRSSRRKQERKTRAQRTSTEEEKTWSEDLLEGKEANGQGGEPSVSGASGCPSSAKLSRIESATTAEPPQPPMPVTSRSKRLRGATTSTAQYKKIAYTDRKTRSASSSLLSSAPRPDRPLPLGATSEQLNSAETSGQEEDETSEIAPSSPSSTSNNNNKNGSIQSEVETNFDTQGESGSDQLPQLDKGIKINPSKENGELIPKVEACELTSPSLFQSTGSSNNAIVVSAFTLQNSQKDSQKSVNSVPSAKDSGDNVSSAREKVIRKESESVSGRLPSSSGENVLKSKLVVGSGAKKVKLVEDKKLNLAPMLLMNNLPYMGELTFDTRPRRGRKPKKADICHLISKNYGIHFPNSYTNVPNTGSQVSQVPLAEPSFTNSKGKGFKGKQGNSGKKTNPNLKSSSVSPSPSNWTINPPALLPLGISRSSLNSPPTSSSHSNSSTTSFSLTKATGTQPSSTSRLLSTKSINKLNKIKISGSNSNPNLSGSGSKKIMTNTSNRNDTDEPLNLCVRDASSSTRFVTPSLSSVNPNHSEIMNLKLPNNLFSDFQLKSSGSGRIVHNFSKRNKFDESIIKKLRNSSSTMSSVESKIAKASGESTTGDFNLVNKLSYQLNLTNESIMNQSNKSRGKSHVFRFAPPITIDPPTPTYPTAKSSHCSETRKSRKRRSPSDKLDSDSTNVHASGSNVDSHAGGCLFGQPDSGPGSGAQVSICKFKFTGGAKPSLQEKKMLSVDSGGNFRFYTDKSTNPSSIKSIKSHSSPYQSTSALRNTSTGGESQGDQQDCQYAFASLPKSAKSMSVCMPVRPSSLQLPGAYTPPSRPGSKVKVDQASPSSLPLPSSTAVSPTAQELNNLHLDSHSSKERDNLLSFPTSFHEGEDGYSSSQSSESGPSHSGSMMLNSLSLGPYESDSSRSRKMRSKRKRRTRKSLMREKLEKTFKEKGFLIQTQQLESAGGATYCKFRQLRKFTRYLFRSWKDYLPDNVRDINNPSVNETEGKESGGPINLVTSSAGGKGDEGGSVGSTMDMELDPTTTDSKHEDHGSGDDSDCEDPEDRMALVPEVTLITHPSSPALINCGNMDSEDSNDVDVENVDGDGTSDNSSLPSNINPHIRPGDNDSSGDSIDNL